MADDRPRYQSTTRITGDDDVRTGYQPRRPDDVEDVPPERLTPPSGESPIANPPRSAASEPAASDSDG